MALPFIQTSFNSGEWAPHLWSRTDQEKYHTGAALLRNFFVDFRGGASTRTGTKYCLRGKIDTAHSIRLITFQASIGVGYACEFGDQYIRFYRGGNPVLESTKAITGATQANPGVITAVAHGYAIGDWIFITGVGGMTQLNGHFYIINTVPDADHFTLTDLFGNVVDTTLYGAYTSGGTAARVFTLASPYSHSDLALLKFVQNVNTLILTHPSYAPYALTYSSPTSWTLTQITFGSTVPAPTGVVSSTTRGAGDFNYAYCVTAVDNNGQESNASIRTELTGLDRPTTDGTETISWDRVAGAQYYNVYRAEVSFQAPIPPQAQFGYIGNTTGSSFIDSNINADFTQTPPIYFAPFATGYKVASVAISNKGSYTATPTVTFSAPVAGGVTATGDPLLECRTVVIGGAGAGYVVGDELTLTGGVVLTVESVDPIGPPAGAITSVSLNDRGSVSSVPANPVAASGGTGAGASFTLTWRIYDIDITNPGSGYDQPGDIPTLTFSPASTTAATATLEPASVGNPAVAAFVQQRLVFAGVLADPNTLYFSRPGSYYNYDISIPAQDNDSIVAPIVSGQLANIKSMVPQPGGLIVFTDGISYLMNGGSLGSAITPADVSANPQSFLGANDMPPIVVNYDVLYAQSKGSSVRDSTYNFYANVFTGTDISVLSTHLFFGYQLTEWAWAEEPYKIVWAVRNDGNLLSLTFIKEQEFIAWAHHDTSGNFRSVCSVVEPASIGYQNFIYVVVQRTINGVSVKYIEYMPERATSGLAKDYWTVDCGVQYDGVPATSFTGGEHLAGKTVTGLADGVPITPFVMPTNGNFTLSNAASKVTVGLAFTPQLQTLYIDIPNKDSTVQSREKKINGAAIRVVETLGLKIGSDADNLVVMKDLVIGNLGRMTNQVVTDLVTGDAFTYVDPKWQEQGQLFFEQSLPYPATICGYIPQVSVGDNAK